ncbi:MAG TPA: substrate-binding domain-containing protein [Acetobacteraceae bacterium]
MRRLASVMVMMVVVGTAARADNLVVYGAGSLREAIGQIATEFGQAHGIGVRTQFGPSDRMRERIKKGEHVDLFTSADVGHARKLVNDGRASVMAVFARNTVCLLSPARFGATTETMLDRLLAPGVRIGMSPPKADPLGD